MSRWSFSLLSIMFILIFIGIVFIYSASAIYAYQKFSNSTIFLQRQLLFFGIGSLVFFSAIFIDPRWLEQNSRLLILFSMVLLSLLYLPVLSTSASGARRWLNVFGFTFQPAELCKLTLIIYLSDYLNRKIKLIRRGDFRVLIPPLFVLGVLSCLIVFQPDLGSVILLFFVTAVLFFVAGIRQRYIVGFFVACSVFFYFAVVKVPYRWARITAYLDPWGDAKGSGFQIIQSFLAFGSGGLKGVGLGASTQKLFYLPQSYTDFIYSIIAEEGGFVVAGSVLLLYLLFFLVGVQIAFRQQDLFKRMVCFSLASLITFQAILNVLVATGLIPTKGLPLPFVSYGGSSLIVNMLAVAIIIAIDRHKDYER